MDIALHNIIEWAPVIGLAALMVMIGIVWVQVARLARQIDRMKHELESRPPVVRATSDDPPF